MNPNNPNTKLDDSNFPIVRITFGNTIKDNEFEQVFKGWMISSSPSVTPFEHPIYDLWIKDCKIDTDSK